LAQESGRRATMQSEPSVTPPLDLRQRFMNVRLGCHNDMH